MLAGQASAETASAAEEAVTKLLAVIGEDSRRQLRELDDVLDLAPPADLRARLDVGDLKVRALWQAILERRVTTLRYFGRNRGQETVRQIEPLRLGYADGAWYLTAYCRVRQEERAFRLDRIESLHVETARFHPRPPVPRREGPAIDVLVRFRGDISRWVRERQHWSFVAEEGASDQVLARYRLSDLDEIAPWLLGWGTAAEVIAPRELRERIRQEARSLIEMLT